MNDNMDKSLFFITLSCVCVWLIVDTAIGKNYLGNFLGILFPFMNDAGESIPTAEDVKETQEKAPASAAAGSNKEQQPISGTGYGYMSEEVKKAIESAKKGN